MESVLFPDEERRIERERMIQAILTARRTAQQADVNEWKRATRGVRKTFQRD